MRSSERSASSTCSGVHCFRLYGTNANPTTEIIEPAKFNKDLYAVLGVSRKASKEEIRAAYMSIVNANHPDRNSSSEALEVFRNATYAYKVLVKDDKALLLSAESFVNSIGEVGEDVFMPLATEVALPLLNLTVRGIGGVAKPLVQDIGDITKAVVGAALENSASVDGNGKAAGTLSRIFNAYKQTSVRQNVNRLNQNLDRTQRRMADALNELQKANEVNVELRSAVNALFDSIQEKNSTTSVTLKKFLRDKEEYEEMKRQLSLIQFDLKEKETKSLEATRKVEVIDISIVASSTKIKELEDALEMERKMLFEYKSKKSAFDIAARNCQNDEFSVKKQCDEVIKIVDRCLSTLEESKRAHSDAAAVLNDDMKSLAKAQEETSRQTEFISIIERKLRQLQEKKNVLQNLLKESDGT